MSSFENIKRECKKKSYIQMFDGKREEVVKLKDVINIIEQEEKDILLKLICDVENKIN